MNWIAELAQALERLLSSSLAALNRPTGPAGPPADAALDDHSLSTGAHNGTLNAVQNPTPATPVSPHHTGLGPGTGFGPFG